MALEKQVVKSISEKIYKKFPEVQGASPKIQKQKGAAISKSGQAHISSETYSMTYHTIGKGPGGRAIPRWVRVVVNQNGKIVKTTTSR